MGRPSCCKPRSQAPSVAAVALIIGAGLAADKIGSHVARIAHVAVDVLRTVAVTTLTIVAVVIAAWATGVVVRWWLGRQKTRDGRRHQLVSQLRPTRNERPCLACGGQGEVLRSDGAGSFEPRACPECQPARLAG
jgi:hypothetical protein